MTKDELKPIDTSKYKITETGQVLKRTKDEVKDEIKNRINIALKESIEIICKNLAELEKENKNLKALRKYELNIARLEIEKLEQENTDLKEQVENLNLELTKAKEIIKKFLEFVNNEVEFDPEHPQEHTDLWNELCEKTEQFIS